MNWDRIILYNLFISSIVLFSLLYCIPDIDKEYLQMHTTNRWAILTDKDDNKIEIEPFCDESWSIISYLNEGGYIGGITLTGEVERYTNFWGYRFIPESIAISLGSMSCVEQDLLSLPAIDDIARNFDTHCGERVRILITNIEPYEIISTMGLTYNAFGFNYYILQVIVLSLIGICSLAIVIFEAKEKRKKRKLQQFLLALS